jgi:hypothetical protein
MLAMTTLATATLVQQTTRWALTTQRLANSTVLSLCIGLTILRTQRTELWLSATTQVSVRQESCHRSIIQRVAGTGETTALWDLCRIRVHVALATLSWRLPVLSLLTQSGMVNSTDSQSSRLSTVRLTTTDVMVAGQQTVTIISWLMEWSSP